MAGELKFMGTEKQRKTDTQGNPVGVSHSNPILYPLVGGDQYSGLSSSHKLNCKSAYILLKFT